MGHRTYSKHTACEMSIQWAFSSGLLSCQAFAVTDFGTSQDLFTSANNKFSFANPQKLEDLETMNWPQILDMNHQSLT